MTYIKYSLIAKVNLQKFKTSTIINQIIDLNMLILNEGNIHPNPIPLKHILK